MMKIESYMNQLQFNKNKLRKEVLATRDGIVMKKRWQKDKKIEEKVLVQEVFLQAETIFFFANFGSEVDTTGMIQVALNLGKTVGLPRVNGENMGFYAITSREELESGVWGIPEPKRECPLLQGAQLIIMPGVAFDESGNRLGYGGGYYDRYLEKCRQQWEVFPVLLAIAYEEQILSRVPTTSRDFKADIVVTDQRIL